jgi:hypothetical protein
MIDALHVDRLVTVGTQLYSLTGKDKKNSTNSW